MILNKTNCKTISKIYKCPYIEQWKNKKIQIFIDKVKAFGEVHDALRIRPFEPKTEKPVLNESHKAWQSVCDAIKNGYTIEQIEAKYQLSEEIKTKLKDIESSKLHYVMGFEPNHIVIDFDIKNEDGSKSLEKNLEAANKWPKTYAEVSKSGSGIHLHYFWEG